MFFKCKHPANKLQVEKGETREVIDKDFEHVTYHFRCLCGELVDIKYANLIGGVDGFLSGIGDRP